MTTATADEFDTHLFVKDMTGEGMPERQAEKLAGYIQKHQHRLVTRQYFREHLDMRLAEVNTRLAELETRLTTRMMWASCGVAGVVIAVLGLMIQSLPGAGG